MNGTSHVKRSLAFLLAFTFWYTNHPFVTGQQKPIVPAIVTVGPPIVLQQTFKSHFFEASALELIQNRNILLIASDKVSTLALADKDKGDLIGDVDIPGVKSTEYTDWEGMAKDKDGNYYVIGSGGLLVRFKFESAACPRIQPQVQRWQLDPNRAPFRSNTQDTTLEFEGLTIKEQNGQKELVVGLRTDTNSVRVYTSDLTNAYTEVLSWTLRFEFKTPNEYANENEERVPIPYHLSSIEYVDSLNGYLILLTTEKQRDQRPSLGNRLWYLADSEIAAPHNPKKTVRPSEIAMSDAMLKTWTTEKAEGLCIVSENQNARRMEIAVTFDNDGENRTKKPSSMQNLTLTY